MKCVVVSSLAWVLASVLPAQSPDFTLTTFGVGVDRDGVTLLAPGSDVSQGFLAGDLAYGARATMTTERNASELRARCHIVVSSASPQVLTTQLDMMLSSAVSRVVDVRVALTETVSPFGGGVDVGAAIDVIGHGVVTDACGTCATTIEGVPLDAAGVAIRWDVVVASGLMAPSSGSYTVEVVVTPATCMEEPYGDRCAPWVEMHPLIEWASPDTQRIQLASTSDWPLGALVVGVAPIEVTLPPALGGICTLLVDPVIAVPVSMSGPLAVTGQFAFPLPQAGTFYFQGVLFGGASSQLLTTRGVRFQCP